MTQGSDASDFSWLVNDFVDRVAGVSHAVVVSSDGLLLVMSSGLPRDRADQLAAVASGLVSLTQGAANCFNGGYVRQTIVEMDGGFLFVMSIGQSASLAVLAGAACDIGVVGYEMALLVARVGQVLAPELRVEASDAVTQ